MQTTNNTDKPAAPAAPSKANAEQDKRDEAAAKNAPKVELFSGPIKYEAVSTRGNRIEGEIDVKQPVSKEGVLNSVQSYEIDAIRDSIKFSEISDKELRERQHAALDASNHVNTDQQRKTAKSLAVARAEDVEIERAKVEQAKADAAKK